VKMEIKKANIKWRYPLTPLNLKKVTAIALHHMAHPTADIPTIHQWHLQRDNGTWAGFGYNYWIDFEGNIYEGRGLNIGAGVAGKNSTVISIGFQGDYERVNKTMPDKQFEAGVWLINYLKNKIPSIKQVEGHKYWGGTVCPGRWFPLEEMKTASVPDFSFLDDTGRQHYYKYGYRGQGITVAVLDSGINEHEDLKSKIIEHVNFNGEAGYDMLGHGTHVAGTIAGTRCGVAPDVKLIDVKVNNVNNLIYTADVIKALKWCYNNRNRIDIVSMSLGGSGGSLLAEYEQAINDLIYAGIPVIVSAGNSGKEEKTYPAYFQEVITVGAVDKNKKYAMFSTQSDEIDVCQLGIDVWSCDKDNGYAKMSGTSMATPLVTGAAALIMCRYKAIYGKRMSEPELYHELKYENTIDVDIPGIDKRTGAGFVNLQAFEQFKDMDKVSQWAKPYVQKAFDYGLMQGDTKGNFKPKDNVTREELATVIVRLYEKGVFK
jgi:major intracellular serine protease